MTPLDFFDIFHAAVAALVVVVSLKFWKKHAHRPRVWVIDDSELDLALFRLNIKLDDCDIRYFQSADSIINAYIKSLCIFCPPSCVVVDYYLSDKIKGNEVLEFFREHGVPSVMVTGYEGNISGLAERDIIRKSPEKEYFREVESKVHKLLGARI